VNKAALSPRRVRIWDLPTRLFHWALVLLVVFSVVTAKIGGNAMDWHVRSGYALVTLLVFRVLWGLAGSHYARFATFVVPPSQALRHARALLSSRPSAPHAGHNALGGWAVIAMLIALGTQGTTGLFAYDDIATEGPWAKFVSGATSQWLTTVHRYNEKVIYALVALHLAAIAYYHFVKRQNLVVPMLTGDARGVNAAPTQDDFVTRLRAAVFAALSAGLVGYLVSL
jgi:cytochrome b